MALCYGMWYAFANAWLCDDAFISYRYAENLVDGLGLVYNAGERVEGYTNFLWVMLLSLGLLVDVDPKFRCGCVVTTTRETRTSIFADVLVQLRHHPVPV